MTSDFSVGGLTKIEYTVYIVQCCVQWNLMSTNEIVLERVQMNSQVHIENFELLSFSRGFLKTKYFMPFLIKIVFHVPIETEGCSFYSFHWN